MYPTRIIHRQSPIHTTFAYSPRTCVRFESPFLFALSPHMNVCLNNLFPTAAKLGKLGGRQMFSSLQFCPRTGATQPTSQNDWPTNCHRITPQINFETCRKTSPRQTNHPATKSSASDSVPRHCTWLCQGESNQTNDQPTKRTTSEHVQAEINFETCRKTSSRQTNHPVLSLVQMIACPIIELGFARENSK
jgi:hypothetical protein